MLASIPPLGARTAPIKIRLRSNAPAGRAPGRPAAALRHVLLKVDVGVPVNRLGGVEIDGSRSAHHNDRTVHERFIHIEAVAPRLIPPVRVPFLLFLDEVVFLFRELLYELVRLGVEHSGYSALIWQTISPDAYVTAFLLCELATIVKLIAWTGEPVLLPRITFGRYRGNNWDEVPADYLAWIAERSELGEDVKYTAQHHRRLRLDQVAAE